MCRGSGAKTRGSRLGLSSQGSGSFVGPLQRLLSPSFISPVSSFRAASEESQVYQTSNTLGKLCRQSQKCSLTLKGSSMYGRAWLWRSSTFAVLLCVQHCQCGVIPLPALPLHHVRQLPLPGLALKLLLPHCLQAM